MTLKLLDPTLSSEGGPLQLAPAVASLQGAVIGLIDNAKIGTGPFYDFVSEILKKEYGAREFIRVRKPDTTRPVSPEMLASLRGADVILSAIGD
jgi:hypothetical protein